MKPLILMGFKSKRLFVCCDTPLAAATFSEIIIERLAASSGTAGQDCSWYVGAVDGLCFFVDKETAENLIYIVH